ARLPLPNFDAWPVLRYSNLCWSEVDVVAGCSASFAFAPVVLLFACTAVRDCKIMCGSCYVGGDLTAERSPRCESRPPVRPVLKHGPRSLANARVNGFYTYWRNESKGRLVRLICDQWLRLLRNIAPCRLLAAVWR